MDAHFTVQNKIFRKQKLIVLIEQQIPHYAGFMFIKKREIVSNWALGKYLYRLVQ